MSKEEKDSGYPEGGSKGGDTFTKKISGGTSTLDKEASECVKKKDAANYKKVEDHKENY